MIDARHGPLEIGTCRVCGWREVYLQAGVCVTCWEFREWAAVNRDACALVHRDSPLRRTA